MEFIEQESLRKSPIFQATVPIFGPLEAIFWASGVIFRFLSLTLDGHFVANSVRFVKFSVWNFH